VVGEKCVQYIEVSRLEDGGEGCSKELGHGGEMNDQIF